MALAQSSFRANGLYLLDEPGAEILSFDEGPIHPCTYEETDSCQVTSMFINNRDHILHRLLDE